MKTVLLLGASGQLGSLIQAVRPDSVQLVSRSHRDLDITEPSDLQRVLEESRPDAVINCAAYTAVDKAEEDSETAFRVNAGGVELLAKLLPENTRLIHLSTDFVFQGPSSRPYTPRDATEPASAYARSKLAGEQAVQALHGNNSIVLRTSWLYSAGSRNFLTTMLRLMGEKSTLNVVDDQYGSPTAAGTLAEVVWRFVAAEGAAGIYHWSDRGIITWYDFAVEIHRQGRELGLLEKDITINPVPTSAYPTPARRPQYSALDSSATEDLLGIRTIPWKEQLHTVLNSLKQAAN